MNIRKGLLMAVVICGMSLLPVMSNETAAPPEVDRQLRPMEEKFFAHDFSKEPEEYRIQRLEKFAFGQSGAGNMEERLGKLSKVIDMHKKLVVQTPKTTPAPLPLASIPTEKVDEVQQKAQRKVEEVSRVLSHPMPVPGHLAHLTDVYDPAVFADVPPDHHARMLTRVAWCEQHVFGKTYPQLHLPQRLQQLASQLLPAQHETNAFQLMDQLDLLVREVVMLQHPPIASLPQP